MNIFNSFDLSKKTQKEIEETIKHICPASGKKCDFYIFYENEDVLKNIRISNHRCKAVSRELFIHDFEICPFPSKQKDSST